MTTMTIAKAINEGLRATLNNNPRALLMGEDIGPLGGVYRVTDGLIAEFGPDRVVDTPLAESGIIGTAIGLSLRGYLARAPRPRNSQRRRAAFVRHKSAERH